MITVLARLTAAAGKEAQMQAELEKMVAAVDGNEPGVAVYSLHTVQDQPGVFLFYEQYASQEAFQAHGQTDHMKALGAALRELSGGRPEITRLTQIAGVHR
ncbi:MAG: antibiotic biosynthesis monooxygenase [Chloroflexi bacterium]|nr:antibiotic biosynthesis monooxygenase [Chloroflexota bacterium]